MTTRFTEPKAGSRTGPALVSGGFGELSARAGSSCLEELNITDPKAVIDVHRRHLDEGAEILRTNTGGASPERLDRYRMHDEAFIVSYMAAEHASKAARSHGGARRVMGVARVEALAPLIGFLPLDRVEAASRTMASGLVGGGADLLLLDAGEVFTAAGPPLRDAAVAVTAGRLSYVGPQADAPAPGPETVVCSLGGRLLTPGLVECHTHLVFGGDRAAEYAERAAGTPYRDIARRGGGIAATVRATRAADLDTLVALARPRLDRFLAQGVTTLEAKSGYGLDHDTELRILRAVAALNASHPIDLVGTFLGAHVVPPEHRAAREVYIDALIRHTLPAVAEQGLAEFCDVFVEDTAFSVDEAARILEAARGLGLRAKVHADQLDEGGGAALAAQQQAVSADHLEHISEPGIAALAAAGTVAVLLPGASLFLGQDARPPARQLIDAGVPVALSTDLNPGTCMTEHLQLMLTLGMSRLGMTAHEVLEAVTCHAAQAIGRGDRAGRLLVGRPADLAVFDVPDHQHLPYHFGPVHTWRVYKAGVEVWRAA